MNKLPLQSTDISQSNTEKIAQLFPNCVTETAEGIKIDFDLLQQELSKEIVEGTKERYRLEWPGKREAIVTANLPTNKTLRPVREDSVNFDTTENLYIEGDNLEVLKLLQESYLGKIKMIYIDPPYNTGTNMIYSNNFSEDSNDYLEASGQIDDKYRLINNPVTDGRFHSKWLTMMYPRVKLARNLLTDDGFVVIAMDNSEIENTIKLCDEIFGENNRVGIVTVVHKPEGRNQEKFFGTSNEYALFYAKNKSVASFNNVAISEDVKKTFTEKDEKGLYRLNNYRRDGGGDTNLRINKTNFWYPIFVGEKFDKISLEKFDNSITILPITNTGVERTWKTKKETFAERLKNNKIIAQYANDRVEIYEKYYESQVVKTHWVDSKYHAIHHGTNVVSELFGKPYFDFPKSIYLIIDILKLIIDKDDTVLDFFSGSATTAHAVMQLNAEDGGNRKHIMVQLPEKTDEKSEAYKAGYHNICEIGKERIRRAAQKIQEDLAQQIQDLQNKIEKEKDTEQKEVLQTELKDLQQRSEKIDFGFRVYRLDSSNMREVYYNPQDYKQEQLDLFADHIKEDRTAEDLVAQVMLSWGLPLSLPIERKNIAGKEVFAVAGNALYACFDHQLDEAFAKELATYQPLRAVFKDQGFKDDTAKENVRQLLHQLTPDTEMKVI